jgi:hypothetical protein
VKNWHPYSIRGVESAYPPIDSLRSTVFQERTGVCSLDQELLTTAKTIFLSEHMACHRVS